MKTKLLYLLPILCFVLASCNDDDEPVINLSQQDFTDIPYDGATIQVDVNSASKWYAESVDAPWITIPDAGKVGETTLDIMIEGNLAEESRIGQVKLTAGGEVQMLTFTQNGKPAGEELTYRIPIVFHVLYNDPSDDTQNIPAENIYEILNFANQAYAQNGIKLEFVPAITDPSGNVLKEAGVDRVNWVSPTIDPTLVMETSGREYIHLLWDPNQYVNILLYNFTYQNILGISTFPLVPKSHPLPGMETVEDMNITLENLNHMRCVSLNSSWILGSARDPLAGYIDPQLLARQTYSGVTLAHELGHYFGLRHVFAESPNGACIDTDYCEDTPSYDKSNDYDLYVQYIWQEEQFNPNFPNEFNWKDVFMRTPCAGGEQFESHNLMDYSYGFMDEFTADQRKRMRHVLDYSPLIPGPKQTRSCLSRSVKGLIDLPHEIAICGLDGTYSRKIKD